MPEFTVYTPTYNRAHTLPRVYDCLKKQSYKDFIWLIIDNGSIDNTKVLVDSWINEAILEIIYLYKFNGGKHTAMELAHRSVTSKYVIGLDSDDILLPEALAIFHNHWKAIEEQGLEEKIAEVRAFMIRNSDEKIIGGELTMFEKGTDYIDSFWHEWVLKKKYGYEMIMALNTHKLNECVSIKKYNFYTDKIQFLIEGIFWSAIGRNYKTRYINQIVGRVFYDFEGSLLRPKLKEKRRFYNHLVGAFYIVDENMSYFWYNPAFFIRNILVFLISGFYLKQTFAQQFKRITNWNFRFLALVLYPLSLIAYMYLRFVKKIS